LDLSGNAQILHYTFFLSVCNVYFNSWFAAQNVDTLLVCAHIQSIDGVYVCVADSSEYRIINMDTGHVQELFSFDSGHVLPTITKISRVT